MFPPQGHWLLTSVAQHLPLTWLVHLFSFSSLWAYKSLFMPQPPSAHICLQFPHHVLWLGRKRLIYDFAECQARVAGGAHFIAFQEHGYLEQGWAQGL